MRSSGRKTKTSTSATTISHSLLRMSVPTVPTGPAPGPINPFPPLGNPICVGDVHVVPEQLSLFPGVPVVPAFAGKQTRLCDRKLVVLANGENAAANFFFFTKAPVAGHIAGMLTDDITTDPRPNSPNGGEKYAPPWLPISMQDWTGREIMRTYSDEWGRYNLLVPSTYTANTPLPSGMTPQMLTACLNSRMMPDPANPGAVHPGSLVQQVLRPVLLHLPVHAGNDHLLRHAGPSDFGLCRAHAVSA